MGYKRGYFLDDSAFKSFSYISTYFNEPLSLKNTVCDISRLVCKTHPASNNGDPCVCTESHFILASMCTAGVYMYIYSVYI